MFSNRYKKKHWNCFGKAGGSDSILQAQKSWVNCGLGLRTQQHSWERIGTAALWTIVTSGKITLSPTCCRQFQYIYILQWSKSYRIVALRLVHTAAMEWDSEYPQNTANTTWSDQFQVSLRALTVKLHLTAHLNTRRSLRQSRSSTICYLSLLLQYCDKTTFFNDVLRVFLVPDTSRHLSDHSHLAYTSSYRIVKSDSLRLCKPLIKL